MERKIGEIFEYNDEFFQCVESSGCALCAFNERDCSDIDTGNCEMSGRSDEKSVVFKKLEKVGEPYTDYCPSGGIIYFQRYKCSQKPIYNGDLIYCPDDNFISIEIKNKEDMEEKKPTYEELLHYYHSTVGLWAIDRSPQEVSLDWICDNAFQLGIDEKDSNSENIGKNFKAFDLQAAKSGKPVCTRDGRKARIICFDSKNDPKRPIVALVENNGNELLYEYTIEGKERFSHISTTGTSDLMMLPEKKEGWVNVSKFSTYASKEEALSHKTYDIIDTIKVSWEE